MNKLTAEQAKKIVESTYKEDLDKILLAIKHEAGKGNSVLHVYEKLNQKTINELIELGYTIPPLSNINGKKCISIHWA
jgi:hypothetical protein